MLICLHSYGLIILRFIQEKEEERCWLLSFLAHFFHHIYSELAERFVWVDSGGEEIRVSFRLNHCFPARFEKYNHKHFGSCVRVAFFANVSKGFDVQRCYGCVKPYVYVLFMSRREGCSIVFRANILLFLLNLISCYYLFFFLLIYYIFLGDASWTSGKFIYPWTQLLVLQITCFSLVKYVILLLFIDSNSLWSGSMLCYFELSKD